MFAMWDAPSNNCNRVYPAPETMPTEFICRLLRIPDDLRILTAVSDMLAYLGLENVWEESDDVEGWQMQALMSQMFYDYANSEGCMIGAIIDTVRDELPDHWLPCDGSTYQREDYPKLYEVLASAFILNADEFVTPDLRARVTIGENLDVNYEPAFELRELNEHGGAENHQLITAQLASHGHSGIPHSHSYVSVNVPGAVLEGEIPIPVPVIQSGATATTASTAADVEPSGGGQAHNNMQPFRVVKKVIVAR